MNLRALFQRLVPPKKLGTPVPMVVKRPQNRKYELEFSNLEDSPRYPLDGAFTVGSEVGELVLDHPSISPRHATFDCKDGLATVMDQGSGEGSLLNGGALPKGRTVILEPGDEVQLGAVIVILHAIEVEDGQEHEAPAPPTMPSEVEEAPEKVATPAPSPITKPKGDAALDKKLEELRKKKKAAPKIIGGGTTPSANTLPRVLAMIMDALWALALWQIFSVFEEFRFAAEILPHALQRDVLPLLEQQIQAAGLNEIYLGLLGFLAPLEESLELSHLLSVWWMSRVLGTALMGMSLGSFMVGIRADGNALWKRAGGVLREVLGLVTAPFLVFDLSALMSRRTLKEVLTRTQLYTPSKGAVTISLLLFTPVTLTVLLVSPLFAGLVLPEPIPVMNVKPKRDRKAAPEVPVARVAVPSAWFGAEFQVDPAKWWVLPRFSWVQSGAKRALTPTLVFYQEAGAVVPLVLERKFEWEAVVGPVLDHNPFAQNSYPTLWKYLQSLRLGSKSALNFVPTKSDLGQFPAELQSLTETAFTLSLENLVDHLQTHGPLINGYMKARHNLLGLTGGAEGTWTFRTMGGASFLVFEAAGAKAYDLFIPLTLGSGRMFRLSYSSAKERAKVSNLAMRELWAHANWRFEGTTASGLVGWIDIVARLAGKDAVAMASSLSEVFGAYYEAAAAVVALPPDAQRRQTLTKSLKNSVEVLGQIARLKGRSKEPFPTEEAAKLRERLTELMARLEAGDAAYFGSGATP